MSRPTDWYDVFGFGDPTPGEPWEIRQVARRWSDVADDAEYAETTLRGLLGDDAAVTWIGQAGDNFRTRSSDLPDQLRKVKDSYRLASEAMYWWAGRLEHHQSGADTQLQRGREAKSDLASAQSKLSSAEGQVDGARNDPGLTGLTPTPEQVQAAQDRMRAADAARSAAQGLVDNAQARLDAAKALAADAGEARRSDGREAASRVRSAADAGLAPRSRWERFKDGLADAWSVLVTIAKVVVAVLGVIVLFIGGPLAWVVLAAALIVLADTLMKYANGEGSLWDVAFAALDCIPGFKGLTTLAALSTAFKSGGLLAAGAHLAGAVKTAVVGLAQTAAILRRGFVPGVQGAVRILGSEGALALPQLRTTVMDIAHGFVSIDNQISGVAARAREWQGSGAFPGIDDYRNVTLETGTTIEVGFPGISNYAAPGGNAAAHGNSAPDVWEGLQVGPNVHDYRGSVVEIQVNNPVPAATGETLANPQYGAGGTQQYFLDIKEGLSSGDLSIIDASGNPIDLTGVPAGEINSELAKLDAAGNLGKVNLTDADNPRPDITYQDEVRHNPDRFRAPDLGQLNIDVQLQQSLGSIARVFQGSGYYGGPR
ncbi:hypothetical protein [Nocardioides pantholopis]|uniref:hypothetical protein n=1 Tax=Nocardioides pantholopis TaxID=2483798 RepID=UPI000FD771FD|nr:hypothetical protein [Nocardioides pantholopis]